MYEIALVEWHVTPEYINENWTEELLALLFLKRNQRIRNSRTPNRDGQPYVKKVSNDEFFRQHGIKVKRLQ